MAQKENVIVLGASHKPERYSYKAMKMLVEHGHMVHGVHPKLEAVEQIKVFPNIQAASEGFSQVDTVTLYLSPKRLKLILSELIQEQPKRVIMNPGTESQEIKDQLVSAGIQVEEACTLVLLSTGQF